MQEIPENAADLAHLGHLHTPIITSGVDLRHINSKTWQFLRHDWKVRARFQRVKAEVGPRTAWYSLTKAELPSSQAAESCCIITDSLIPNDMKHVSIQGPVGTGAGAKPALLPDVCEAFFNRVWAPLPFTGSSCCGQTGKSHHAPIF